MAVGGKGGESALMEGMPEIDSDTVDGRNPAPGMYETLKILGKTTYKLVQDFSHQQ